MPSLAQILDDAKAVLDSDSLVAAAASTALSPEGKNIVVSVIGALEQLEAHHAAEKQAAVEQASAEATAAAQAGQPQQ